MRRSLVVLVLAMAALAATGCARVSGARFSNPMALSGTEAGTTEKVVRRVLTDMRFEVEYPAFKPGRVTTNWLTGDSWFEFWRQDTVGSYQIAESSLSTIRRRVIANVTPKDSGSEISIRVLKQRRSAPTSAPSHVSAAFSLHRPESTDLVRQDELAQTGVTWVDTGRDELLEQRLLELVMAAIGRPMAEPPALPAATPAPTSREPTAPILVPAP